MTVLIYEGIYKLNRNASKKHLIISIDLEKVYETIKIEYKYIPVVETNEKIIKTELNSAIQNMLIDPDCNVEKIENLITPSIRLNNKFLGAHHSFDQSVIEINKHNSSPGFKNIDIEKGKLEIIMSCHAIVSEDVTLETQVYGIESVVIDDKHMKSKRLELHTHTHHSDATFTVDELMDAAKKREIDILGMTDHNTVTGYYIAKKMQKSLKLLPGIEYTTFDGHFLCLGELEIFEDKDFTNITRYNIKSFLNAIKHENTFLVMAHPYDNGSPICTGCRYSFDSDTYPLFDAIEVWNGDDPNSETNQRALQLYKDLLLKGNKVVMTSGRDWHDEVDYKKIVPNMKIWTKTNPSTIDIIRSLKNGYSELQKGFNISTETNPLPYGRYIDIWRESLYVEYDDCEVRVDSNLGYLPIDIMNNQIIFGDNIKNNDLEWIIIEKYINNLLVAIGNPIYNIRVKNEEK